MAVAVAAAAGSRLGRLIRASPAAEVAGRVACELCALAIPEEHRHLLVPGTRRVSCSPRRCEEKARGSSTMPANHS